MERKRKVDWNGNVPTSDVSKKRFTYKTPIIGDQQASKANPISNELDIHHDVAREYLQRPTGFHLPFMWRVEAPVELQPHEQGFNDLFCPLFQTLQKVFKLNEFRGDQKVIVQAALDGLDTIVIMATGGGKSLCYMLPAVMQDGVTIVVSPLRALIQNQLEKCANIGIKAASLDRNSPLTKEVYIDLGKPDPSMKILFVTPELLCSSTSLKQTLHSLRRRGKLRRFVFDEAHCISEWGNDFRPAYNKLSWVHNTFPNVSFMALTATATDIVLEDVTRILNLTGARVFRSSVNRSNLCYCIQPKSKDTLSEIIVCIQCEFFNQSGIIYCCSRSECESVADQLKIGGIAAAAYHAALSEGVRETVQCAWLSNETKVIVATIAFGMGIDKSDVRFVFHYSMAKSLGGYYQECGRAGRDGQPAKCILYYKFEDMFPQLALCSGKPKNCLERFVIRDEAKEKRAKDDIYLMLKFCENKWQCRRSLIMTHFGEADGLECISEKCDNCCNQEEMTSLDVTCITQQMLECLGPAAMQKCITYNIMVDILKGSRKMRVVNYNLDRLQVHGSLKEWSALRIKQLLSFLVCEKLIEINSVTNAQGFFNYYLKPGSLALNVEKEDFMLALKVNDETCRNNDAEDEW